MEKEAYRALVDNFHSQLKAYFKGMKAELEQAGLEFTTAGIAFFCDPSQPAFQENFNYFYFIWADGGDDLLFTVPARLMEYIRSLVEKEKNN